MHGRVLVNPQQSYCSQERVGDATTRACLGLGWEEAARMANRHTLDVQSWLSSRAPQAARFEGLGITATSTGLDVSLLNLALCSHFPPGTDSAVVDREVEAVKRFFVQRGVPFSWWLSPFACPADMGAHLSRHHLHQIAYRLPTMVAPLGGTHTWPALNPAVQVWQARTLADLQAASTIRRTAFGFKAGAALTYFEDMAADWLRGDPARLYVARTGDEGPPVAIGALIMGAGVPGIYVMATLPGWERRGLGKAILTRALSDAEAAGHSRIVLTAGAKAYSLYKKFGFAHIFEYEIFKGG